MRTLILICIYILLGNSCFTQSNREIYKLNQVKYCWEYNTDINGNTFPDQVGSLSFKMEYDTNGNQIAEDNLIKGKAGQTAMLTPVIKYFFFDSKNRVAISFAVSKDRYIGELGSETFLTGGDTSFYYNYKYENGYTIQEFVDFKPKNNNPDYEVFYHLEQHYVTKWKTDTTIVLSEGNKPHSLETETWERIFFDTNGIVIQKMQSTKNTHVTSSLSMVIVDTVMQVYPSFDLKNYTVENRVTTTVEDEGYQKTKVLFINSKKQICYKVLAIGSSPKIYNIYEYQYYKNGLVKSILGWHFLANEKFFLSNYTYEFY